MNDWVFPTPNLLPFFSFFRVPLGTNGEVYLFALSQQHDDEVYLFPLEPARDPWHTARLSLPATCDCRTLMTCYLPRWAPVNGLA